MKKYLRIICCLLLVSLTTACYFDDKLSSETDIINKVNLSLPNAEFINTEEVDVSKTDHVTKRIDYHFNNDGIEFIVSNYLYMDEYAWTEEEHISDTYMKNVWDKKNKEFEKLFEKYSRIKISITDYDAFYFTPLNYNDIEYLSDFFNEYLELVKEYLPFDGGAITSDITITLYIPNIEPGAENMFINKSLYIDNLDEVRNNSINELKEKYLKNVKLGYIDE